jgi:zinc transport system ATP-binding protein
MPSAVEALKILTGDYKKDSRGPGISFEGVSLQLGQTEVLSNLSFTVEPETIHCIIGPNGGGKTSLLRSVIGQMPHTGSITVRWPAERRIGYVPQILDFDRTLPITVLDFMAMIVGRRPAFLGVKKNKRKSIELALEAVGMGEKINRLFGQLSGGEKQRVLLAQALSPVPGLLLLDEPMAGVDDSFIPDFEQIVTYLKKSGVTIFWINHDLGQVMRMADTVSFINKTLLFSGPPEENLTPDNLLDIFSSSRTGCV